MWNGLEKRLSRLEQRGAERTRKPRVCDCRVETRFHGADCLDEIVNGMARDCPSHGFRELGFFFWTPRWCALIPEDNQFCPCHPHPWRSFLINGPHTWEAHHAAREAWNNVQKDNSMLNLQEDNRRADSIMAKYFGARQHWVEKAGRQLPSREELVKLQWKRARKHVDQEARESV
jgi:hypothetical protein